MQKAFLGDPGPLAADAPDRAESSDAHRLANDIQRQILDASNALTMLFAMQCTQSDSQSIDQESAIRDKARAIQDAIKAAREAAEAAREAAEDKSIWDDICSVAETIGTVAAIAASAASCVASGGITAVAAVALVGMLLSASAKPISEELGGGQDLAQVLSIVGGVASACGGVGTAVGVGAVAAEGGATANAVRHSAVVVRNVSMATEVAMTATRAYATYRSGSSESDRLDYEADGAEARAEQRAQQRDLGSLVDALKELNKSFQNARQSLLDAQKDLGASQMNAINVGRFA
jgi:hypothetical protein